MTLSNEDKQAILLANGFSIEDKPYLLIKSLDRGNDRFPTELHVYTDRLDVVYINRYKSSGLRTIEEDDILHNHNNLHTYSKEDYVKTMAILPFLKSRL